MANARQVFSAVLQVALDAVQTYQPALSVQGAVGFPATKTLHQMVQGGSSLIGVYNAGPSKDATRWNPYTITDTPVAAGVKSALSTGALALGSSAIMTLSGTPIIGDGVSLIVSGPAVYDTSGAIAGYPFQQSTGVVAAATTSGTTLAALAAEIANLVNNDPTLSKWLTATSTSDAVQLTCVVDATVKLATAVGNGGTRLSEVGRVKRPVRVSLWTQTEELRGSLGDPIDSAIAQSQINWLTFADGTYGNVAYEGDEYIEQGAPADVYRRDYLLTVDYSVTAQDALYQVLVLDQTWLIN